MNRSKLLTSLTRNLSYKLYRSHNRTASGKTGQRDCRPWSSSASGKLTIEWPKETRVRSEWRLYITGGSLGGDDKRLHDARFHPTLRPLHRSTSDLESPLVFYTVPSKLNRIRMIRSRTRPVGRFVSRAIAWALVDLRKQGRFCKIFFFFLDRAVQMYF